MSTSPSLESRVRRLEDRMEIGELIARYCVTMDNRDIPGIRAIFTPDIVINSADGVMNSTGIDAVMAMFEGRFKVLGPSNHFTHDRIIQFDTGDADRAHGLVLSHAEMNRNGMAMLAAMRYEDVYQRYEGQWRFKQRTLGFFYYVPATDYVEALQSGLSTRMRAYEDKRAADWPESLGTWKSYYGI